MPHDKNGTELKVGDTVQVAAKVLSIQPTEDYCNLSLETVEPMYPGDTKSSLTLNAKQVVKQDA